VQGRFTEPIAMVQSRPRALLASQALLCCHAYELRVVNWSHSLMLSYTMHQTNADWAVMSHLAEFYAMVQDRLTAKEAMAHPFFAPVRGDSSSS